MDQSGRRHEGRVVAAPLLGLGLGTAIGAAAHTTQTTNFAGTTMTTSTPKGIAIGSAVGLVAGSVVSLVLLARSHHFYMGNGFRTGDGLAASGDPRLGSDG